MRQPWQYSDLSAQADRERPVTRVGTTIGLAAVAVMFVAIVQGCDRAPGGSSSFDVVEAKQFVLTDEDGRRLAVLEAGEDGLPALVLKDDQGRERVRLAVRAEESPTLDLFGPTGRPALSLTSVDGSPALSVHDREGRRRTLITTTEEGVPHVSLFDVEGRIRAVLGAASVESRVTEEVEIRPVSSLILFNKFGEVVFAAPTEGK